MAAVILEATEDGAWGQNFVQVEVGRQLKTD